MTAVTIYDVAREAGVSIKTVSRVLNKEPNVRGATREKVQRAAEALGYHPSLFARSLAGSRSHVIAAFVDAALTIDHWRGERTTDYLTRVQLGATLECREAGYHFMLELVDHDPLTVSREIRNVLGALKPDGALLTPPSSDDPVVLALLAEAGVPYVRLGAESPGGGGLRLHMDDAGAAAALTEHLIGLGHRRIGFIMGDAHHAASLRRLAGFRDAMARHGLDLPESLVQPGDFTFQSGVVSTRALLALPQPPTAIIASNDDMALGCLAAMGDVGLTAPRDLSVAGFDDSNSGRASRPPLTTIRQPLVELAAMGVRALISGEVGTGADRDVSALPFALQARASTGPAPGAAVSDGG
ncbi:MAG: LacI family DNA-binding transcriptional regulator [Caulobacterales bacterium]|nr:LacI family DNA-binding transcriptional regulator [Caulobacterales bacterium]